MIYFFFPSRQEETVSAVVLGTWELHVQQFLVVAVSLAHAITTLRRGVEFTLNLHES